MTNIILSTQMIVLIEYSCGRELTLLRNGKTTAEMKDPRKHFGDWWSTKSDVHSRVNDSAILILFLIYHDRAMLFKRWIFMLDVAINKCEAQLVQTDRQFITDRRMLLLSIKKIMTDFCQNIHLNDRRKQPISLRIVSCYNSKYKNDI